MMYEESQHSRRIFGAIETGIDLVDALTTVCSERDIAGAELRAVGTLADVELARFDASSKQWVSIAEGEGPFDIVSLSGNVSTLGDQTVVRADALLAVMGPAGQQLVFGQIRKATVVSCEFVVDAFADLEIERKLDPQSQMLNLKSVTRSVAASPPPVAAAAPRPTESAPAESVEPATKPAEKAPAPTPESKPVAKASDWVEAAKASDTIPEERDRPNRQPVKKKEAPGAEEIYGNYDFNEPILGAGDILDHPKLGRCRVIKVEDDEYAHIRMSRGQIRKLALSVVDIHFVEEDDDGRNVFKVKIRR